MGVRGGKFAVINATPSVGLWSLSDEHTPVAFVNSATKSGRGRRNGIKSWSGSFEQHLAQPTVLPGASFSFAGYTSPDDDLEGSNGQVYSGTAFVSQCSIEWDWAGGNIIKASNQFQGHLGLTIATALHQDATIPNPASICGAKIEYSTDGIAYTELENVRTATLNLTSDIQSYVNSSTSCNTGRKSGPVDWTATITLEDNTQPVAKGADLHWKFWVNATQFWLLSWGQVGGYTNLNVNRESGEIISQDLNIAMNGFVSGVAGQVLAPDATTRWWGVAP